MINVDVGQLWVPKPGVTPAARTIRIVCHYDFESFENEELWVVEYLGYPQRLERMSERTLRDKWHPAEDAAGEPH